ncbi:cytochrome P450 [Phanerochaete sordida]|uniref:Cytochrome P450 n=1 Tax=Phanerochaete sordida TaxID=48140 RepID=A0A9P3GGD7_9APHY|nr:cytochrome P450 [Phanerochaete sordida]
MSCTLALASLLLSIFAGRALWARFRQPAPFPPGPPADPLIGNVRAFPTRDPHLGLAKLAQQYGDVIYFNIFGKHVVVLSSQAAASDLLEKRSAIYSSRPRFTIHEMIGWTDQLSFLPYGSQFHKQRKLFQQTFSRQGCLAFQPSQLSQTHALLKKILQDSARYQDHVREYVLHESWAKAKRLTGFTRFSTAVIMEITYGHKIKSDNDPYVKCAEDTNKVLMGVGHSASILDLLPALRYTPSWFPGNWFTKFARESAPVIQHLRDFPFKQVRQQMASGTAAPCFTTMHIEELDRNGGASPEDLHAVKIAAAQMWAAGAETTWSTILNLVAIMLLHPDAQRKAQAELDVVLGGRRLPDFADRDSLPYLEAVLLEAMRLHPTAPMGVPHSTTADDIYRGMFIPKGTTILANSTALGMDAGVYRDPAEFRPERFLPPQSEPLPTGIAFGWGRRMCPGRHLADASVWIVVASLLAAFEIVPAKDEDGQNIIPEIQWVNAITSHPAPFPCVIRPRSDAAAQLVAQL